ncbi:MAG: gamma-glutamyltransferase family protein [Planctomycetaceae bacterium]|jgi:gamma-glutamyltranspeptidase/glutathione hydrolase
MGPRSSIQLKFFLPWLFLAGLLALGLAGEPAWSDESIGSRGRGRGGAIAAGHPDSVAAGLRILRVGGNAADAAAATLLALAVSDYGSFAIGGEVPVLIYNARTGQVKVLCGMGVAPRDPSAIDWFLTNGIPSQGSMKAAPTPGAVDLVVTLLREYGTISFSEAATPMLELLDRGQADWHPRLARTIRRLVEAETQTSGQRPAKLQAVSDRFYKGDIADELEQWYIATGAFLRKRDLASHVTHIEDPVAVEYRGYTVYKCPTWSQGPVLCQNLRLLEGFELQRQGLLSADSIHHITEAMKLGYADRDDYYGDPLFTAVPVNQLFSDEYTRKRRTLIDPARASLERRPGDPWRMEALRPIPPDGPVAERKPTQDTTTCVVADRWGNVVAATPSCNMLTNTPGPSGVNTGNRVRSLNTAPGHPNQIHPGKRPRITLTPTLVLRHRKPVAAVSVAGGDLQDQTTLQVLINHIDFGLPAFESVSTPRFYTLHHQDSFNPHPDRREAVVGLGKLVVNEQIAPDIREELARRGHLVSTSSSPVGNPVMITIDPTTGQLEAAGDPRAGRHAAAID